MWYVAGYRRQLPTVFEDEGTNNITVVGGSCLIFKDGRKVGVVILDEGARALVLSALCIDRTRSVVGPNSWLTVEYDDRGGILLTLAAHPWYVDGETISVFVEYHDIQWLVSAITNGPIAMRMV